MKTLKYMISLILLLSIGSSERVTLYQGVLDRIEDNGQAVILIESIPKMLVIPLSSLPPDSEENMWFTIRKTSNTYQVISIDYQTTMRQRERSSQLLQQLRHKEKVPH